MIPIHGSYINLPVYTLKINRPMFVVTHKTVTTIYEYWAKLIQIRQT